MSDQPSAIPHAARIYDYLIGGDDYTPADQAAAAAMTGLIPSLPKWLPMLRDYLPRIAATLYDQGFRHFVDFASGLPHRHLHSALGDDVRIVYSDIDAEIVARGQAILRDIPHVRYVAADVTRPRELLADPAIQDFLGRPARLAVGLSGVSVFLQPADFAQVLDSLYDTLPRGSAVFITYETQAPDLATPALTTFKEMMAQAGGLFRLYTRAECLETIGRWTVEHFTPLAEFLGRPADFITPADREGVELEFYSALLKKL